MGGDVGVGATAVPGQRHTWTDRAMFLSACWPPSSNAVPRRSRTCSYTRLDTQTASGCRDLKQPGCDVDAVAEDVIALDDNVAKKKTKTKNKTPNLGDPASPVSQGHL